MDWQILGIACGSILLSLATLRAAGALYTSQRRQRIAQFARFERQAQFKQRLHAELQWARAMGPKFKAWSGTRSFRVGAIVDEAVDCKSFYLLPVDGKLLPRFEPGQYLTFQLPAEPRRPPLVRCYSLSERPRDDYYRVTIKQQRPPRSRPELPPGRGSSFFHRQVSVGSTLQVQAPQGSFFLDPTKRRPVVLIGAGIGITPILSMVDAIVHEQNAPIAYVVAGFGNSREHPFRAHMQQLAEEHDHLRFDISYSRPAPSDLLGRDYHHRGYVSLDRLERVLPSNNFEFYLCGPAAMMESLVSGLIDWGVPERHIHFEAFGPASVRSLGKSKPRSTEPCNVRFATSDAACIWEGGSNSILELAEQNGVVLDYGCRAGNCGQCEVAIRAGKVAHVKEPGVPVDEHHCLTCVAVPQGDVVLEA